MAAPHEYVQVVDTHTGGEPTRVVVAAPFELKGDSLWAKTKHFATKFDGYRRAIVCEPRGSDVVVGALLLPPESKDSVASVIFFNNVGCLGMCGHGTIGVAIALEYLGRLSVHTRLSPDDGFALDTPVGIVRFQRVDGHTVRIQNVASYRYQKQVKVLMPAGHEVHGDIAWGGNWFFICQDHGQQIALRNARHLEAFSLELRRCVEEQGVTGADGALIDHIELLGPPTDSTVADARNFVLCPGGVYDRSPCGTGTSAKLACLAADGKLAEGEWFRQQSIVGSVFRGRFQQGEGGQVLPTIEGEAYVTGEAKLVLDANDPFRLGMGFGVEAGTDSGNEPLERT
ncbi:MAG: proline racemase family protein [Pirellulaceae bacterium]